MLFFYTKRISFDEQRRLSFANQQSTFYKNAIFFGSRAMDNGANPGFSTPIIEPCSPIMTTLWVSEFNAKWVLIAKTSVGFRAFQNGTCYSTNVTEGVSSNTG
uniref:Uncharacterized protein n=1 Tax=Acrobeloides nanus TaxID=290746 RepID=A0A914EKX4_9BILA